MEASGVASQLVTSSLAGQIWRDFGILHILDARPLDRGAARASMASPAVANPVAAQPVVHASQPHSAPATPRVPPAAPPAKPAAPAPSATRPPAKLDAARTAPFPPPWDRCWELATQRVPRAATVWTYFMLGQDLLGDGEDAPKVQRRQAIRRLIASLGWPRGAIAFWPLAVPLAGRYDTAMRLFWQGVQRLDATRVFGFGKECEELLNLGYPVRQCVQHTRRGRIIYLPDVESLLEPDGDAVHLALARLREHAPDFPAS